MTISCPVCSGTTLNPVRVSRHVEADDGSRLRYAEELTRCGACGERFYTHEQALASSRIRAGVLRRHERLLTPSEIRKLRARLKLSQADLERLLGLGAKTVVRWERGTVCQSRAVDTLLRLLDHYGPGVLAVLSRERNRRRAGARTATAPAAAPPATSRSRTRRRCAE